MHRYGKSGAAESRRAEHDSYLGRVMSTSRIGLRLTLPTAATSPSRQPSQRYERWRRGECQADGGERCPGDTPMLQRNTKGAGLLCTWPQSCSRQVDFVRCQRDTDRAGDMLASRRM